MPTLVSPRRPGMLLFFAVYKWLCTAGYLSASPVIYVHVLPFSVSVALIACVWHHFETFDDSLTNICKMLRNIKSEMLHCYKWNRANKRSFAESPRVERWAGPTLLWCVFGWGPGVSPEKGLVGRQPRPPLQEMASSLESIFFSFSCFAAMNRWVDALGASHDPPGGELWKMVKTPSSRPGGHLPSPPQAWLCLPSPRAVCFCLWGAQNACWLKEIPLPPAASPPSQTS